MFLMEKRVVEGGDGRGKTSIWFLFVELNSEPDCLFPAMSGGKYVLVIIFKFDSSPGQWLGFSLKQEMYISVHTKHCFHVQKYT